MALRSGPAAFWFQIKLSFADTDLTPCLQRVSTICHNLPPCPSCAASGRADNCNSYHLLSLASPQAFAARLLGPRLWSLPRRDGSDAQPRPPIAACRWLASGQCSWLTARMLALGRAATSSHP